jgi:hypothetical protein
MQTGLVRGIYIIFCSRAPGRATEEQAKQRNINMGESQAPITLKVPREENA